MFFLVERAAPALLILSIWSGTGRISDFHRFPIQCLVGEVEMSRVLCPPSVPDSSPVESYLIVVNRPGDSGATALVGAAKYSSG